MNSSSKQGGISQRNAIGPRIRNEPCQVEENWNLRIQGLTPFLFTLEFQSLCSVEVSLRKESIASLTGSGVSHMGR